MATRASATTGTIDILAAPEHSVFLNHDKTSLWSQISILGGRNIYTISPFDFIATRIIHGPNPVEVLRQNSNSFEIRDDDQEDQPLAFDFKHPDLMSGRLVLLAAPNFLPNFRDAPEIKIALRQEKRTDSNENYLSYTVKIDKDDDSRILITRVFTPFTDLPPHIQAYANKITSYLQTEPYRDETLFCTIPDQNDPNAATFWAETSVVEQTAKLYPMKKAQQIQGDVPTAPNYGTDQPVILRLVNSRPRKGDEPSYFDEIQTHENFRLQTTVSSIVDKLHDPELGRDLIDTIPLKLEILSALPSRAPLKPAETVDKSSPTFLIAAKKEWEKTMISAIASQAAAKGPQSLKTSEVPLLELRDRIAKQRYPEGKLSLDITFPPLGSTGAVAVTNRVSLYSFDLGEKNAGYGPLLGTFSTENPHLPLNVSLGGQFRQGTLGNQDGVAITCQREEVIGGKPFAEFRPLAEILLVPNYWAGKEERLQFDLAQGVLSAPNGKVAIDQREHGNGETHNIYVVERSDDKDQAATASEVKDSTATTPRTSRRKKFKPAEQHQG